MQLAELHSYFFFEMYVVPLGSRGEGIGSVLEDKVEIVSLNSNGLNSPVKGGQCISLY